MKPLLSELPRDPIGGASGPKKVFTADFVGKTNDTDFPYTVANEVVAAFLGQTLGLNIPTVLTHVTDEEVFALIQMVGKETTSQHGPPASAARMLAYVNQHQDEIHGAIVFDLFVANNDRAFGPDRRNVRLATDGRLVLIDYGNACFYRNRPKAGIDAGVARLESLEQSLEALFDMEHKGNHYWQFLTDWSLVRKWCERISQLPDFLIEAAVRRIPSELFKPCQNERDRLCKFLLNRRHYLLAHILNCSARFTGLPPAGGSIA